MRHLLIKAILGVGAFALLVPAPFAADCSGSDCLSITKIRYGESCGFKDSMDVEYQNVSSSLYVRGYIVFTTPSGPWYEGVGLLKPGEKGTVYRCHASGAPRALANTGTDPGSLRYPARK